MSYMNYLSHKSRKRSYDNRTDLGKSVTLETESRNKFKKHKGDSSILNYAHNSTRPKNEDLNLSVSSKKDSPSSKRVKGTRNDDNPEHQKKSNHSDDLPFQEAQHSNVELQVWNYLLNCLDEAEKLIALKLLIGIQKMKKQWQQNVCKEKYVEKKEVDELKKLIKTMENEQHNYENQKKQWLKEKNDLNEKLLQERKCRVKLAEILVKELGQKYRNLVKEMENRNKNHYDDKKKNIIDHKQNNY